MASVAILTLRCPVCILLLLMDSDGSRSIKVDVVDTFKLVNTQFLSQPHGLWQWEVRAALNVRVLSIGLNKLLGLI